MPTVYVPNIVRRKEGGQLRPLFDLTEAARYGNLKEVIGEFDDLLFVDKIAAIAQETLKAFGPDDYLLAIGDPTAIAICSGVLFQKHQRVNLLKWDRQTKTYILLELNVCPMTSPAI